MSRVQSLIRRYFILIFMSVALTGCSGSNHEFNAKDITGLMPELAYELTNTAGNQVTEEANAGTVRMMFFGFTSCPDICPTTLQKLSKVVSGLPDEQKQDVQIVFVSVDPNRDTPERIKSYVEFFSDRIVGLTGPEPALRDLSKRYRTTFGYAEPDDNGNYDVSHSGAVYVFDRQGQARLLVRPEQSIDAIREDILALARENA